MNFNQSLLDFLSEEEVLKMLMENTLYQVITGSTCYGLNTKDSDEDIKSITSLPKEHLFKLNKEWETMAFHKPDIEFHSLKKAFLLLNSQNPTVLEMLYVLERFILKQSKVGQELRKNRSIFLSQNCYHSFGGYAARQLMRIKNAMDKATLKDNNEHLDYTLNHMIGNFSKKYHQIDKGKILVNSVYCDENGKQNVDMNIHFDSIDLSQLNGIVSELFGTMKTYNKLNNRNRKPEGKLEKHAMHLARLLLSGIETLDTGSVPTYQEKHKPLLMSFRQGDFEWDDFFLFIDDLNEKLKVSLKNTSLPKETDFNKINELYTDLMLTLY